MGKVRARGPPPLLIFIYDFGMIARGKFINLAKSEGGEKRLTLAFKLLYLSTIFFLKAFEGGPSWEGHQ